MSVDRSTLEASHRDSSGKGTARRLRAQGLIPAVVYGRHLEAPAHISVDPAAVKKAVATPHRFNTLINLKVKGGSDHTVLLKDYQQDPVSRAVLHADFVAVKENEQVKVKLPVVLVGKAEGTLDGGILSQIRREIEVWALPASIPEKFEVDVTPLKIAQALHISDVKLPAGITVKTHVNFTLAVVSAPEAEVAATPAAAAAAPAAGAAKGADAKGADAKGAAAPAKGDAKKK